MTHEWLTWVSTHLLPSFPHSWTSPLPGIQPGTRICAPETFPGDNQPKSTRAGFGWDKAHFAHSTVRGWGLALYLKWWKKSSLSQPKAAHHRLVKWHKYGSRKNTYLGMRGSTTVQTGYSHLLLQNTNGHLIKWSLPVSLWQWSVHSWQIFYKQPLQEAFWKFGKLWTVLKTKY